MAKIKDIIIIYNPNSTGDGEKNAKQLQRKLKTAAPDLNISLRPTEFAGHAEEIVKQLSLRRRTLVISSSGDGGYHEIINGALAHGEGSNKIITGLLPSGNANDHYNSVHRGNVVARILQDDVQSIDMLKVSIGNWTRYAHSYAGIGLTPHIGEKLTQAKLNPFNEVWLTLRYYFSLRPVKIRTNSGIQRYDSLVFSNIDRMSKYLTLSSQAIVDDGKFEVTGSKSGTAGKLMAHLFKASITGLTDEATHVATYSFTSVRPFALQLDGEVFHFAAGSHVTITSAPKAINCII